MNGNRLIYLLALFLCAGGLMAQTSISGTINSYDKLITHGQVSCGDSVVTAGLMNYNVGDLLMFYNPGDAFFVSTDNASFGDSVGLNHSGKFKFAYVTVASTPLIQVDRPLGPDFGNWSMIIKVPEFGFVESTGTLTAPAYNNGTGGVFVLRAERFKFTADIDMDEKGFKGGFSSSNMGVACGTLGYRFASGNNGGAPKGEGVGIIPSSMANGRGHAINAGGGGNNHNAGGGGGGGGGTGGNGGDEWSGCAGNVANGGIGGQAMITSHSRFFMGGGGGSGHNNVSGLSSEGGNGGGLVMIIADTLEANGGEVLANGGNGKSILNQGAEGAGGGGGGGTSVLSFKMVVGMIVSRIEGGDGGSINGGQAGPGGGGGGGHLCVSDPSIANYSAGQVQGFQFGGDHGTLNNGSAYGSTDGTLGSFDITLNMPFPSPLGGGGTGSGANVLGNDTTICSVDSILLSAPAGANSILWSTGDTVASIYASNVGWYWLQYTLGGCLFVDSLNIQHFAGGTGSFLGPDQTLCQGGTLSLSTSISGNYLWSTGGTNNSITVTSPGWYWLDITINGARCPVRDSIFIDEDDFSTTATGVDTTICAGDVYQRIYPPQWLAFWPDGSSGQQFNFSASGNYLIRVENENGCERFDTLEISTFGLDSVVEVFEEVDTIACASEGYPVDLSFLNGSVLWDDGRTSKIRTLFQNRRYIVTYEEGCLSTKDTLYLEIIDCDTCGFALPDAFSPNGDGLNDHYLIKSDCEFEYYQLYIIDRWGEVVFESQSALDTWDGTFKGKDCSQGVYIYDLRYRLPFKQQKRIQGSLFLRH